MKKFLLALVIISLLTVSSACGANENSSSDRITLDNTTSKEIYVGSEKTEKSEKEDEVSDLTSVPSKNSNSSLSPSQTKSESKSNSSKTNPQKTESITSKSDLYEKVTKVFKVSGEISLPMPEFGYGQFYDDASGKTLPYRLYLPENYKSSEKYPVFLWLHGAGERGENNTSHITNLSKAFDTAGDLLSKAIIIAPQCPSNGWWNIHEEGFETGWLGVAMHLLFDLESKYSLDTNRIYVAGLSMGGYATWSVLENYNNVFAAGVPICGWGNVGAAQKLAQIPIWIYHGDSDPTVSYEASQSMYNAIKGVGGEKIHFTTLKGVGHNAWDYALKDRGMFCWMFAQSKGKYVEYKYTNKISITSPSGEVIFTDEDIESTTFFVDGNNVNLRVILSNYAARRLKTAYKNNMNKEFNVYYYGSKLYLFKPLKVRSDDTFDFPDTLPSAIIDSIMLG